MKEHLLFPLLVIDHHTKAEHLKRRGAGHCFTEINAGFWWWSLYTITPNETYSQKASLKAVILKFCWLSWKVPTDERLVPGETASINLFVQKNSHSVLTCSHLHVLTDASETKQIKAEQKNNWQCLVCNRHHHSPKKDESQCRCLIRCLVCCLFFAIQREDVCISVFFWLHVHPNMCSIVSMCIL